MVQERIVDNAEDRTFLIDETEGDAREWEPVDKVGGAVLEGGVQCL